MNVGQVKPTAYVVDDDEAIRTLWRWLMESNGIAVETFNTAAEFIAAYKEGSLACLVLDVRLPGMSGLELQEYLKRQGIEIPIVFVSGHGDVPTAVSAATRSVTWERLARFSRISASRSKARWMIASTSR